MRRRGSSRPFVAVAIAIAALVACTSDGNGSRGRAASVGAEKPTETSTATASVPSTDVPDAVDTVEWGECNDPLVTDEALRCATLTVPLDYEDPAGATIDLALVKVPAVGTRKGAILFNPGGPGGSGFDPIATSGSTLSSVMGLDGFDLIGFDPHGVDRSGGLKCVSDAVQDKYLYTDDTPDTPEEQALLDESEDALADGCTAAYGDTLRFYSTVDTARDIDAIREGLGDEQISFLGISYGTYLGATYATMFPDRVRAMVLDSAYAPQGDTVEEHYSTQLVGFEGAFDNWAAWCQGDADSAFTAPDVGGRWDALEAALDATPVIAPDGREGNAAVMTRATIASMYARTLWPQLADALAAAEAGDVTGIFRLADEYNGRRADGTFATLYQSFAVINCASGLSDPVPDDPEALAAELRGLAPRFAKDITADDLTDGADESASLVGDDVQPTEIDYAGDGPIVVVGGANDPATPIRWAEELTGELGPNARLVTFTGEGHGQLLASTCVTAIEAAVLTRGELPDEGTVCDPDEPVAQPAWWGDIVTPPGVSEPVDLPQLAGALGLVDTLGYGEIRTSAEPADEVADAYDDELTAAGFTSVGPVDLPLDDSRNSGYLSASGDALVVLVLGPAALDDPELAAAKPLVPADTTLVVLFYVPS